MVGIQVTGKRLGIVGLGRVGRVVAQRARGFDMEIHYHDSQRLDAAPKISSTAPRQRAAEIRWKNMAIREVLFRL